MQEDTQITYMEVINAENERYIYKEGIDDWHRRGSAQLVPETDIFPAVARCAFG
jgi:hypothetical protein